MKPKILKISSYRDFTMPFVVKGICPVRPVSGYFVALPGFHLAFLAPVEWDRFYTSNFNNARNLVRDGLN